MKKAQFVMVWFLPLVVIGGFFYPILGYFVLLAILFMLILSIFKARFWCWNFCPRGSYLDLGLSKISRNKAMPRIFTKEWFRWTLFAIIMSLFIFQIIRAGGSIKAIGLVFVIMCAVSTIIATILGVAMKHRTWCMICPMGLLQEKIGKIKKHG
ncbi:MAG: 4Fe-4S binding protein [Candidatus Omnitrophota bacterium]|nr:4Fe-4S binding protein [Candidatus Omnitrophota bacterium]